ncbi:Uma2 family endonuclease [Lewinella sp. JB7]|uniref:Uma2 family endonuclease n=1 Tax=Lewinella sp. JB7 TaxID=2962887 RepID=UPI002113FAAA|nr:Uma2 family endonuclease [Lewinella sp. JB7]
MPPLPDALLPVYSSKRVTADEFAALCEEHPDMHAELEVDGRLKIMSPVGGLSGNRENEFNADLTLYARAQGGKAFSASTGFRLPDGSIRSPDAAYLSDAQLSQLSPEQFEKFIPAGPVFIIEVLSVSDGLREAETKMRDTWIANGVRLAWLADVDNQRLWIYRADHSVELVSPLDRTITGEDVLPGFTFDLNLLA